MKPTVNAAPGRGLAIFAMSTNANDQMASWTASDHATFFTKGEGRTRQKIIKNDMEMKVLASAIFNTLAAMVAMSRLNDRTIEPFLATVTGLRRTAA